MKRVRIALAFFVLAAAASAQPIEETARALAKTVAARLAVGEIARVTARNQTTLPSAELARARTAFVQGLKRNGRTPVEVTLTISENARGYLLISELRRGDERAADLLPFDPPRPEAAQAARPAIQKTLIWEQETPILDVAVRGDLLYVLQPDGVATHQRLEGRWGPVVATIPATRDAARDPRGRFTGDPPDSYVLAGPANTFQEEGIPAYYSRVHWGTYDFAAEPDGIVHVYNEAHQQVTAIDPWGSDLAIAAGCGILATAAGDRTRPDTVIAWDWADRRPRQVSEAADLPGPVTALWPSTIGNGGTLAVVHDLASKRYAAYLLTLDCSH
jgi:hypothetical protein